MIPSASIIFSINPLIWSSATAAETFQGTAARTGTLKRPLLIVGSKRYELKPSHKADNSVADLLKKFSSGDTGRYLIKGKRGNVKGNDGIVVVSITPAKAPGPSRVPAPTKKVPRNAPAAATSTKSEVAASAVTVGNENQVDFS